MSYSRIRVGELLAGAPKKHIPIATIEEIISSDAEPVALNSSEYVPQFFIQGAGWLRETAKEEIKYLNNVTNYWAWKEDVQHHHDRKSELYRSLASFVSTLEQEEVNRYEQTINDLQQLKRPGDVMRFGPHNEYLVARVRAFNPHDEYIFALRDETLVSNMHAKTAKRQFIFFR